MGYSPFDKNHVAIAGQGDIAEICRPLCTQLDFSYFHYAKFYRDGSFFALYNRTDWHDYFWDNEFQAHAPIPVKDELTLGNASVCLWEGAVQDEVIHDARQYFDIERPLSIVVPHEDHFECFAFAGHQGDGHIVNTYFNNMPLLMRFTRDFRDQAAGLIARGDANLANTVVERQAPELVLLDHIKQKGVQLTGQLGPVSITKKELQVAHYVSQGLSAAEISEKLHRSTRTVETHINNLKSKLGCRRRSELVSLLLRNLETYLPHC